MSTFQNINLLDLLGKMFVQLNAQNSITDVNTTVTNLLEVPKKELIGKTWESCFSKVDFDGDSISTIHVQGGSSEENVLTSKGKVKRIAWHKTKLYDDKGQLDGMVCIGEDVTKHENYLFTLHQIASLLLENKETVPYKEFIKLIGEAANADHSYVFLNYKDTDGQILAKKVCEWGKNQFIDNEQDLPGLNKFKVDSFSSNFVDTLKEGNAINLRVSSFPEWEQSFFSQFDIQVILLIPILVNNSFYGFVGFDNRVNEREWTNSELEFLKASVKNLEQCIIRSSVLSSLKASELKFKKLSGLTMEGIIIHENGIVKEANLAFLDMVQYSVEDVINHNIINLVVLPEYHAKVYENLQKKNPVPYDVFGRKKDGTVFPIEVEAKSLSFEDEILRVVAIRDITERKKSEFELVEQKNKAEESSRLKTQFLNNMSHEIRTPLNGIVGFTQFLNDPTISVDQKAYFTKIIQSSSDQLLRVIDDIIEISKLETKQVRVIKEEVELNSVLLEIFSIFEFKAKEKNLSLYLNKGLSDERSVILTDKLKLQKVLNNLVENALKFTHSGKVEIGYQLNEDLEIWVKDTGIGIPKENRDVIFDRFSQVECTDKAVYGGLGLGLSIAKENTDLIGGHITVESEEGEGSVFQIRIPYECAYEIESSDFQSNESPARFKVLVAEDEEVNFIFLEFLLHNLEENVEIKHVRNGQEAVNEFLTDKDFDLVLMDLKMPVMNGLDATTQIRELSPEIPIVAITAYSSSEDSENAIKAGCSESLTKPIQVEDFTSMCKRFLVPA